MKIKNFILKNVPLFTNKKYYDLFYNILYNFDEINKIDIKEKNIKNKDLIFDEKNYNNEEIYNIKTMTKKIWEKLLNSIHNIQNFRGKNYKELEICYIKKLAKIYYNKLLELSHQKESKKNLQYIISLYLELCKSKIKFNDFHQKKKRFSSFQFDKNSILFEDDDDVPNKKKIVNLFIGKFDVNKFLDKEQIIEFKKGEFVNAFIFTNKKPSNLRVWSNSPGTREISIYNKHKKIANKKETPAPEIYGEKNYRRIHRFNSTKFIDNINNKLLFQKKYNNKIINNFNKSKNNQNENEDINIIYNNENKKTIDSYTNRNLLKKSLFLKENAKNLKLNFDKNDNKSDSKKSGFYSSRNKTNFSLGKTQTTNFNFQSNFYFPELKLINKNKFQKKIKFNKSKIKYYLSKNDMYY
jgi:hypothetical protein